MSSDPAPSGPADVMDTDADTLEDALASYRSESLRPQPYLFLVLECDRPAAGGARYCLASIAEIVIGRGNERSSRRELSGGMSRLMIRVPGRTMSSTHARIRRSEQGWIVEDTRSATHFFYFAMRCSVHRLRPSSLTARITHRSRWASRRFCPPESLSWPL